MGKLQARLALLAAGAVISASVLAQSAPLELDIGSQPLSQALNILARQSGAQIVFVSDVTAGKVAPALKGKYSVRQALERLLEGSNLRVDAMDERTFAVVRNNAGGAAANGVLPLVTVAAAPEAGDLPAAYAGGQVARGARLGLLGNRDVMSTPFNITSYTADLMEDQQARSLADVLASDPSARFISPAAGLSDDFLMRGFVLSSTDIALNGLYGLMPYYRVPTEMAERVEVLKGPSALLSGITPGGAVGGSINVVPKRAGDKPLARVTASYISDAQFGTHLDVGRRFGEDNEVGVRFNGAYRNGGTNIDNSAEKLALGALGLDYRGQRLRASLDVISQQEDIDGTRRQPLFASNVAIPSPPPSTTNWFPNAYSRQKDDTVLLHGEYDLSEDITGFASAGTRRSRSQLLLGNPTNVSAQGVFQSSLAYWNAYTDTTAAEAGMKFRFNTGAVRHELVASSNILQQEDGRILSAFSTAVTSSIYAPVPARLPAAYPGAIPKISESTLTSFALADTLSFAEGRVLVMAGARKQFVSTRNFGATGAMTSRYDADALTPMVGVVVKPLERLSLYANYIEGLSPGQAVNDIAAPNNGEVFAPYKTKQYEAGVKFDFGKVTTGVSLFQITKPSLLKDPVSQRYSADGEQRNRGLEWNVAGEVADHVRVLGGAAYTNAVLTRTAGGVNQGNRPLGVPKRQANLGAEWDLPMLPQLTLLARAIYTSQQYVDTANKQSIPGWIRYDAGARLRTRIAGKDVVLRANVENLLNKNYWVAPGSSGYMTLSAPRTFLLSATVDF